MNKPTAHHTSEQVRVLPLESFGQQARGPRVPPLGAGRGARRLAGLLLPSAASMRAGWAARTEGRGNASTAAEAAPFASLAPSAVGGQQAHAVQGSGGLVLLHAGNMLLQPGAAVGSQGSAQTRSPA